MNLSEFYRGKRVLVTGNTGFKGAWLTRILTLLGAEVTGYSMDAPTDPAFYHILKLDETIRQVTGDIRDLEKLSETFRKVQPEIVLHLAAQPIVRESYRDPVGTYATNVMGTVNLLECVRMTESVSSVVNVTTDKVYLNREWEYGYRENERLDGFDPYSNSKSCSELVTASYRRSFFGEDKRNCAITTCRAGNVIGGGDFAKDRIIPDCVRAAMAGEQVILRNPYSIRPYQHVLDPLYVYLMLAMEQQLELWLLSSFRATPGTRIATLSPERRPALAGVTRDWEASTVSVAGKDAGPALLPRLLSLLAEAEIPAQAVKAEAGCVSLAVAHSRLLSALTLLHDRLLLSADA